MRVRVERRELQTRPVSLFSSLFSLSLALLAAGLVFLSYGVDPIEAYRRIFVGSFGSLYGFSETVVKAIPLMLCAVGLSVAFRARLWNIGAEGQLLMGAIGGTWSALAFSEGSAALVIPVMFLLGFLFGALWGLIPGLLRARFGTQVAITSLMMNYIAERVVEYLVYGPWKGPSEWGFPYTSKFSPSAQLPRLPGTRIHYPSLVLGVFLAVALYILMARTRFGFEVRVTGENPDAAKYAGVGFFRVALLTMLISGGLAGLAGVGEVAGIQLRLRTGISPGYGYTAIIVAWLARLNSLLVVPVSLLFGGLLVGGDAIQLIGLPFAAIDIFNGLILLFMIGGEFLMEYSVRVER
jgi:simple sugar transport system permease protein